MRSSEYQEDTKRSLLHIEADSLHAETRNRILGEVFGLDAEKAGLLSLDLLDGMDEEDGQTFFDEGDDLLQDSPSKFHGGAFNNQGEYDE